MSKWKRQEMNKNLFFWILLIVVIIIIFLYNRLYAIWLTLLFLGLAILSYAFSLTFKKKLMRTMQKYSRIPDAEIAEELNSSIEKVRQKLSKLHKHQKKKRGLIVFLSNRYIYYNEEAINEFKRFYTHNVTEKEIFENLKDSLSLKTRAEVKAIIDTLINHKKVDKESNRIEIKNQIRKKEIH